MDEQNKKVKKNKANVLQESSHSGDSMHMKVKDKKRMKKKKNKIFDDVESPLNQIEYIDVKDGAELGTNNTKEEDKKKSTIELDRNEMENRKVSKKGKKISKDGKAVEGKESVADKEKLGKARKHDDEQTEEIDANNVKKKRKKRKKMDSEIEMCVAAMEGEKKEKRKKKKRKSGKDGLEETVHGMEEGGKRKKRDKSVNDSLEGTDSVTKMSVDTANLSENPKSKSRPKKVRFSAHVEIFPSSDDLRTSKKDNSRERITDLVQGKRFSPEEDEVLKAAVFNYIDEHGLGEDGLDMVMHCNKHRGVKGCWNEIALALPWRPKEAVYHHGRNLFMRCENRGWTPEEYEIIRRYHEKHGSDWSMLADALGKNRIHLKDTWRRIKLVNLNKGRWSQEEYQRLFDLVNMDLQMKVFEEKKSKHGMLRDNISWGAISDKLATRMFSACCEKWYSQLTSPMVAEGKWADTDDLRMLDALCSLDACCMEDVDWDNLLEHRSGDVCRKRWTQMVKHIGEHGKKLFSEQVEVLLQRYRPELLEAREEYARRPAVDEIE